ncbi:MAG: hypothetical protein PHN88_09790 [Ignavibacteria bacterium]|nr:hypothetical protein [Ignavibacteria bacterium]
MHTYFFEIKTDCSHCGNPLLVNAFAREIRCDKCNQDNIIGAKLWKVIVVDSINEASNYQDGQKRTTKMFTGGLEFSMSYGKRNARCSKCRTMIPDNVFESFEGGEYKCAECGNAISIRKPDDFVKQILPSAKFIAGEDTGQIKTGIQGIQKPEEHKPVIFTCPACAANLKVDGTKRIIDCTYCDASIYLPDDLWFELHPAKTVETWYVINN